MNKSTIPFVALDREFASNREDYMAIFEQVMSSGNLLQGPSVECLESQLAELTNRDHAIAVNSCTDALFFALEAAGIGAGDEVLVTSFSFIASVSCVLRTGATPVFCDIDPTTFHLDPQSAAGMISHKTRAIVYPSLFGVLTDPEPLLSLARKHHLLFIEDSAQSLGATFFERPAGSFGDLACLSFDPTKVIPAPGSGGAVVTDDTAWAERIRRLRYHGKAHGSFLELGYNSQMPSLTAALLSFKLTQRGQWEDRRRHVASRYGETLDRLGIPWQKDTLQSKHIYHKFVILLENEVERDRVMAAMKATGIAVMIHYRALLSEAPCSQEAGHRSDDLPNAKAISQRILSLPIHPWLTDAEVDAVCQALHRSIASP